jgi:NADH-quinone oxidoreductase subunit C/D
MTFEKFITPYLIKKVLNTYYVDYSEKNAETFMSDLNYAHGFNYLIDLFSCDFQKELSRNNQFQFLTVIHLKNLADGVELIIKIATDGQLPFEDLNLWGNSRWSISESYDLFGVKPHNVIPKRLLTTKDFKGHPLLKNFIFSQDQAIELIDLDLVRNKTVLLDENIKENWVEVSPEVSGDSNFYKMYVDTYADQISRVNLEVGYGHQGIEKSLETLNPIAAAKIIDDVSPQSLSQTSFLYCKAVEDLLGLEVSERVKIIRMILCEFGRISEHMSALINFFKITDAPNFLDDCVQIKDRVHTISQRISGNRFLKGMNTIGGINKDIPLGWSADCIDFVTVGIKKVTKRLGTITSNKFVFEYLNDLSLCSQTAIKEGLTGPLLRSSGINYDVRKASPYYYYENLDFDVPVGINGQLYDLMIIRFAESIQSMRIIIQLLDNIPGGKINLFSDDRAFFQVDELFKEQTMSFRREVNSSIEASNGEMSIYLIRGEQDYFNRVKLRTPSFVNLQGVESFAVGQKIDNYAYLSTLANFSISEVDR